MKNNQNTKVDIYKKGYQTGEFNKKQFTDFYKIGNLYCDNVHFEQKYIEIENDQGIVSEELFEIEMYGKFIGKVKNLGMKQTDKLDVILNKLTNMDIKFTNAIEALDNKFTNAIQALDNKFTKAIEALDNKFTNAIEALDNKFTKAIEALDNKFTKAIETLDNKFTNAIVEIKIEIKEIKNDIKDIKSCPTIKKELEMLKK